MTKRKAKYPKGTVLKHTPKASKLHPTKCRTNDRYLVIDAETSIWFDSETNEIFNQFDCYQVHDSFVEIDEAGKPNNLSYDLSKCSLTSDSYEFILNNCREFNIVTKGKLPGVAQTV